MSARKPKRKTSTAAGTTFPWTLGYTQRLYTIQVSEEMLKYVKLMAEDPHFRSEVDSIIQKRGYPLF